MTVVSKPFISLESGDRLTRDEFHRRYCARPDIKKAELVKGVVYVASPSRSLQQGEPHAAMAGWLYTYALHAPNVRVSDNATVYLSDDSELQPDVSVYRVPSGPGGGHLDEDGYIEGAPELVVEIAASSVTYDLHDKMDAYREAGVPEYIVWRVLDCAIDWFELRDGVYVRRESDARGMFESRGCPGLRLNVPKMLAGDDGGVVAELSSPA
jgi:Uma2 family endonuclease